MKKIILSIFALFIFNIAIYAEDESPDIIFRLGAGIMGGTSKSDMVPRVTKMASYNENFLGKPGEYSYGHIDTVIEGGKASPYPVWAKHDGQTKYKESEKNYTPLLNFTMEAKIAKDTALKSSLVLGIQSWDYSGLYKLNGFTTYSASGISMNGFYNNSGVEEKEKNREIFVGAKLTLIDDWLWITPKIIKGSNTYDSITGISLNDLITGSVSGSAIQGIITDGQATATSADANGIYPGLDLLFKLNKHMKIFGSYHAVNMKGNAAMSNVNFLYGSASSTSTSYTSSSSNFGLTELIGSLNIGASSYQMRGSRSNAGLEFTVSKYFKIQVGHFKENISVSYPN